ncbi:MAG: hypothetical protein ACM3NF_11130 [Gemmatimonadota bacterium]
MAESGIGSPERRPPEKISLFGLVSFRPRVAVVLVLLTVTVAAVAMRIARDSGLRKVDALVRDAVRIFAAARSEAPPGPPLSPETVEERVREWTGIGLMLPRGDEAFSFRSVSRERFGRQPAAAVRIDYGEDLFLLLLVRQETLRGFGGTSPSLFGGAGFISGERDGKSFVFWEKDGASFILVSDADLTRTFDLVRRHLT